MSDVIKLTKKVFTVGVVMTTIMWSVGASFLVAGVANAVSCQTLKAGDVVKSSNYPALYTVNSDLELVYWDEGWQGKTWEMPGKTGTEGAYPTILTVDPTCISSNYKQRGDAPYGISVRPGSLPFYRPSTNQLYYIVDNFTPKKITSEAAELFFGKQTWRTASVKYWAFFSKQEITTGEIGKNDLPPKNMLLTDGTKYYVATDDKGAVKEVTSAGMTANGYNKNYAYKVDSATMAKLTVASTTISAEDATLTNVTKGAEGTTTTTTTTTSTSTSSGTLTVALNSTNPTGGYLADNSAFNTVLKFDVTAKTADVQVTGVKLKKYGYAANASLGGIMLYDGDTKLGNTVSSLTADAEADMLFSATPVTVKSGETKTFTVKVNIADSYQTGDVKLAVTALTTNSSSAASGLPVTGNGFTLTDGSNSLFGATLELQSTPGTSTVKLDTKAQEAYKVKVNITNSVEDVYVDQIRLYNRGNASDTDIANVVMYDKKNNKVATGVISNRYITFKLASPLKIDKGGNDTLDVYLDVKSGASRTIQLVVFENEDVMLRGASSGAYVLATGTGNDTTYPIGDGANTLTVGSGTLTVSESGTPTNNVAAGETNVVLGKFKLRPNGENMELRKMRVVILRAGGTDLTGTVYVKVNSSTVYSASASALAVSSAANMSTALTTTTALTMSTYYNMPADTDAIVEIVGSVNSSAVATTDGYGAGIDVTEVKRVSTNDILDPATAGVNSAARTVSSAALAVSNVNWQAGTLNVIKGTSQATLAKWTVNAGSSGEDVRISSFVLSDTTTNGALASDINNLYIYEDGVTSAYVTSNSTASITATSSITFTFTTPIVVKKTDAARTFYLKGDVSTAAGTSATHQFAVTSDSNIIGADTGSTADSVSGTAQTVTVATGGSLIVSYSYASGDSYTENGTVSVASSQSQYTVFAFKAYDEDIKVTSWTLTATGTLRYTDFATVNLYKDDATTAFATAAQFAGANAANKTFTFSSSEKLFEVKAGTTVKIRVKATVAGEGGAKLGDTLRFITNVAGDITAKGVSTGSTVNPSLGTAISYVKQIVPFGVVISGVTPTDGSSQTLTVNAGTVLGQFKVLNNGTAAITMGTTTIFDGGSNSTTSLVYELYQSAANSTAPTGAAIATATKSSSQLVFGQPLMDSITIQPGEYRTLTIKVGSTGASGLVSGDTFQLYVSAIGNVTFTVTDANLGYDGDLDGSNSTGSTQGLYVTGKPSLGQYVKT